MPLDYGQELVGQFGQMLRLQINILTGAVARLDQRHRGIKMLVANTEGNLAEKLDETTPGVVAESRVAGQGDQTLERGRVEAEVEDGVHHARHRHGGTRAH